MLTLDPHLIQWLLDHHATLTISRDESYGELAISLNSVIPRYGESSIVWSERHLFASVALQDAVLNIIGLEVAQMMRRAEAYIASVTPTAP